MVLPLTIIALEGGTADEHPPVERGLEALVVPDVRLGRHQPGDVVHTVPEKRIVTLTVVSRAGIERIAGTIGGVAIASEGTPTGSNASRIYAMWLLVVAVVGEVPKGIAILAVLVHVVRSGARDCHVGMIDLGRWARRVVDDDARACPTARNKQESDQAGIRRQRFASKSCREIAVSLRLSQPRLLQGLGI